MYFIVNVKNMEIHRVIMTNRKTLKCTIDNLLRIYDFCTAIKLIPVIVWKSAPQGRKIDSVPVNKTQILLCKCPLAEAKETWNIENFLGPTGPRIPFHLFFVRQ